MDQNEAPEVGTVFVKVPRYRYLV